MGTRAPKVLVVGSLVMDLITTTRKIPGPGETVIGLNFSTAPGGKGANQAYQAAKLGANVTMVGKVGNDAFGQQIIASLTDAGVDTSHVQQADNTYTAVGNVQLLTKDGKTENNRIIVAPGGNYELTVSDIAFLKNTISEYDIILLQLEIPMEVNEYVAKWAAAQNVPVMLNPAPSAPLSAELLSNLSYISPNEYEAADITGIDLHSNDGRIDHDRLNAAMERLHNMGVSNILITLGSQGCAISSTDGSSVYPCVPGVNAVDPTAAGDSFVGAFCTATASGLNKADAITVATYTAAITVSGIGAQPSLPSLSQVIESMQVHHCPEELIHMVQNKMGGNDHD